MALPDDVTTCSLTFGPYTDAAGEPVFAGMTGTITPSVRQIRHAGSGSVVIDEPIPVKIDAFGSATIEGIAHTQQDSLSPNAFTYTVVWNVASRKPSPGNKQIALPPTVGAVVDFDLLGESDDVEGVYVPTNYGKSAYDLAVANGFVGSEAAWLSTLKGDPGDPSVTPETVAANLPARLSDVELRAAFVPLAQLALNPDMLIAGTITRDANGAATAAPVTWPDGTPGTYTATTVSTAFPGAVDAYAITYGSPVTKTYTQPAVTRDGNGAVTARPAVTVS